MVVHATITTPVGLLDVAATERGISHVRFVVTGSGEPEDAGERHAPSSAEEQAARAHLAHGVRELGAYFDGELKDFSVPLDYNFPSSFRGRAQAALTRIPYGATCTYKDLAAAAESPKAVRAAGGACAHNPLPIFIPCHRVLPSTGGYGFYIGGPEAKRWLVEWEKNHPSPHSSGGEPQLSFRQSNQP
ncbi:methylated-DNA--[protein]-cysteine S-methyltransferase [Corynebacterium incognita]|uniref:methylated-DNA--[protein]-cysteine S-methyltransferase n=1 Tax=Corynebacterium incognita TaxID=2754725 RepID=A0A7G7CSN6_9CORY|nr:methylated-DNA--[protein]-cysteine S-methyltransferase [Corynebacterium incognita]